MAWEDFFEEMRKMQEEINRNFEGIFSKSIAGQSDTRQPAMEVMDKGEYIIVTAELPGLEKSDIEIEVSGKTLTISANRKVQEKQEKEGYYYSERSYSRFYRTVPLPAEVIPEETKATYKNGVLEVTLKKVGKEEKKEGFRPKIE